MSSKAGESAGGFSLTKGALALVGKVRNVSCRELKVCPAGEMYWFICLFVTCNEKKGRFHSIESELNTGMIAYFRRVNRI